MSRIYTNGYRIDYPNELAYAGMPAIVRVSQLDTAYIGVGITIKVGENYYTETRTPYNGEVVFDISRYMQLAFVGKTLGYDYTNIEYQVRKSELSQPISVVVQLTDSDESTTALSFDTTALFGNIGINQANGGQKIVRRWFTRFPQTIDFYIDGNKEMWFGTSDSEIDLEKEPRVGLSQVFVNLSPNFFAENPNAPTFIAGDKTNIVYCRSKYLVGDEVIDSYTRYRLLLDHRESGVYLRWLDHLGHWCYYLFTPTGRNYTTKETQSWQDGILRNNLAPENGVFIASGQQHQQLSQQESISLGVKLVDAETYDFLLTLTNSPIVEVFVNADDYGADNAITPLWERVSIVAGSYARTSAHLQDFTVSIVRNTQTSQML